MEDQFPPSNCVVHDDTFDWGGLLFLLALAISPTKTYIFSMKGRNKYMKKRHKKAVTRIGFRALKDLDKLMAKVQRDKDWKYVRDNGQSLHYISAMLIKECAYQMADAVDPENIHGSGVHKVRDLFREVLEEITAHNVIQA